MSYVKLTLIVVGTVTTLFVLYTQRQTIGKLLHSRRKQKKRGTVKTVKLEGDENYTVSYFEQGQLSHLPTLLLFHGFTSTKGTWRTVLEKLPDSIHVIAVDLPGHGGTTFRETDGFTAKDMAARMHQFTETLGLKRFHVGGQSLGGVVTVVFASLYANQVESTIVVCPGMATSPMETEFYRDLDDDDVREATVRNYLIPETPDEMKFFFKAMVKNKDLLTLPENHLVAYLNKRKEQNAAFRHMWSILSVKMKDPLANFCNLHMTSVRCPTLIVWGDSDEIVHPCGAQVLHAGIAKSVLVIVPNCGHTVTVEKPEILANHMVDFLALEN